MKKNLSNKLFFWITCALIYFNSFYAVAGQNEVLITPEPDPTPEITPDPLEKINRIFFNFNDKLDCYILKPIAILYNKIVPKPLNLGIHNVFSNLNNLPTIGNDILQLHFYQMTCDVWRFAINTTVGIGGLFDIASTMGLKATSNDFGLTLARWGWNHSTYLVLPFFGPNTFRDGIDIPVDYYAFSIYPRLPESATYALFGISVVDRRAQLLKFQDVMEEAALDRYVFFRNAYLQRRSYQIEQNKSCYIIAPPPSAKDQLKPDPGYLRLGN